MNFASLVLSGQDAQLIRHILLAVERGLFSLNGQEVQLLRNLLISAEHGSFNLSGQDVEFLQALRLSAEHGSFSLDGQDAALLRNLLFSVENGSFQLNGQDADLSVAPSNTLIAEMGQFHFLGQIANLQAPFDPTAGDFNYHWYRRRRRTR